MQAKLSRPSRFADWFNRFAIRWGFPPLAWLAPRLPRWLLRFGARVIIGTVFLFYPGPRRAAARNLGRVLGEPPSSRRVARETKRLTHHLAYYWVDLFRYAQLPSERARGLVDQVSGLEHLEKALARGKGVVLITGHLGNWELGGVLLGQNEVRTSVVYVPDQFAEAEAFRSFLRQKGGVREIAIRPGSTFASLPALRALQANEVVAVQGDRDFDDSGIEVEFFGRKAPFPRGPILLSLLTGAALIPTFIAYTEDHRVEIEFGAPLPVAATGDRDGDIERALEAWVVTLEAAVRRWPNQWYSFYDFWSGPSRKGETA